MVHAAAASKAACERILHSATVTHIVDTQLVDPRAAEFPITPERYARLRQLVQAHASPQTQRVILSCSVYNGIADRLSSDLGVPVERSDARGAVQSVEAANERLGILVSYPPSAAVVESYVRDLAATQGRALRIETALASGSFANAADLDAYAAALGGVVEGMGQADTIFLSQYSMDPLADRLRARFGRQRFISALEATARALASV